MKNITIQTFATHHRNISFHGTTLLPPPWLLILCTVATTNIPHDQKNVLNQSMRDAVFPFDVNIKAHFYQCHGFQSQSASDKVCTNLVMGMMPIDATKIIAQEENTLFSI